MKIMALTHNGGRLMGELFICFGVCVCVYTSLSPIFWSTAHHRGAVWPPPLLSKPGEGKCERLARRGRRDGRV